MKNSVIKLLIIMLAVIAFGHYARSLEDQAVMNTWLSKQTLLIRQENNIRQKETELNQLKEENNKLKKEVSLPSVDKMALKVKQYFADDFKTALMVFKDESGLNPSRMNWNCYYGTVSTSCKPSDHALAWSVDCGLTMINVIGQTCPQELFNVDTNLKAARRKYEAHGFMPWVVYWSQRYLRNEEWFKGINKELASI